MDMNLGAFFFLAFFLGGGGGGGGGGGRFWVDAFLWAFCKI